MNEEDCIFCKIVSKQLPSKIVQENNDIIAFLDIFPISKGHTIIIPKNHFQNIEDIPDQELAKVYIAVKEIAIQLHEKLNLEGYQKPTPPQEPPANSANVEDKVERKTISVNPETPPEKVKIYLDMGLILSRQRVRELNRRMNP